MRVLYTSRKQWKLSKECDAKYRNLYEDTVLCYGELPENAVTTYDDFSDAIEYFEGHSMRPWVQRSLIFNKPRLVFDLFENIRMSKSTFRPFDVRWYYKRAQDDSYSVHDLLQKLTVPEFIQYCKDNGLNLQSIVGGVE